MRDPIPNEQNQPAIIAGAWRRWLIVFVPFFAMVGIAEAWLGPRIVLPILIGLAIVALLYQRFVKRRSWRSIM